MMGEFEYVCKKKAYKKKNQVKFIDSDYFIP